MANFVTNRIRLIGNDAINMEDTELGMARTPPTSRLVNIQNQYLKLGNN